MASQQPIFRTIEVGHDQPLTLGEPLTADVRVLMDPPPPSRATQLTMKSGTFGRAASIQVDLVEAPLGEQLLVQQVEFSYSSSDPSYDTLLQEYTEMLGPPHDTGTLSDAQRSAVWSDASTRFTLWERGGNSGSILTDLVPAANA
jgi:hypothetical protein